MSLILFLGEAFGDILWSKSQVDGKVYNAIVEPVTEHERLIGRDVLNQMKVTFDGPSRLTTID